MRYQQGSGDDADEFENYDPTPYGGGYDITLTYGRSLPPSNEICYPIGSSTRAGVYPQNNSPQANPSFRQSDAADVSFGNYSGRNSGSITSQGFHFDSRQTLGPQHGYESYNDEGNGPYYGRKEYEDDSERGAYGAEHVSRAAFHQKSGYGGRVMHESAYDNAPVDDYGVMDQIQDEDELPGNISEHGRTRHGYPDVGQLHNSEQGYIRPDMGRHEFDRSYGGDKHNVRSSEWGSQYGSSRQQSDEGFVAGAIDEEPSRGRYHNHHKRYDYE